VDSAGTLYVADTGNCTIRQVTAAGVVTTLAGTAGRQGFADGVGPEAEFAGPTGVAVDEWGNVYVADAGNNAIRKVTQAGVVSTVAGVAGQAGTVVGPLPASLGFLGGLAIDPTTGGLLVTVPNAILIVRF